MDSDSICSYGEVAEYAEVIHTSLDAESVIETFTVGDFLFLYRKTKDQYELIKYLGDDPSLSLPETVNGHIYGIGMAAFMGADIYSIVLPEGVRYVSPYSFKDCRRLFEIYNLSPFLTVKKGFSGDSSELGYYAIAIHTSMDEPSILTRQGDFYFYYKQEQDAYYLFSYLGTDANVVLPDDINGHPYRIHSWTFRSNPDIASITIPKGVTEISGGAFYECGNLTDAFFEITSGWVKKTSWTTTPYESTDLADSQKAATALKKLDIYYDTMVRSEEP